VLQAAVAWCAAVNVRVPPGEEESRTDRVHRIESCSREIHRFVSRRVPNPADAADLSQQTLLLACSKLDTLRGESVLAWLYTIAQHLIIDYYRTRNRFHFVELSDGSGADAELALRTPPDAVLALYEFREKLKAWKGTCANELHLEHQVAVLLADVYGYQDKDSAAMLRMSLPSFKLLLHEARARLKEVAKPRTERPAPGPRPAAKSSAPKQTASSRGYRVSVACRVPPDDLRALHLRLMKGLTEATLLFVLLHGAAWNLLVRLDGVRDLALMLPPF
jgi:RNA polymerase sigma factor (sigma-70 family)